MAGKGDPGRNLTYVTWLEINHNSVEQSTDTCVNFINLTLSGNHLDVPGWQHGEEASGFWGHSSDACMSKHSIV